MATTIVTKNGSGVPLDTDLVQGELAIDLVNKRIYSKDPSDEIIQLGSDIDIPDGVNEDDMLLWSDADDKWTTSEYVPSTEFSTSPPANPKTGMLWQDTTPDEQALYCWDGTAWVEIVGANGIDGGSGQDAKQIWSEVTSDGDIYYNKGNALVGIDTFNNGNFSSKASGINAFGEAPMVNLIESGGNTSFYIGKSDSAGVIGTQDSQPIKFYTSDSHHMTIDADGNVGIGTADPSYKTEISTDGDTYVGITSGDASLSGILFGKESNKSRSRIVHDNDDRSLQLWSNSAERMRIKASGDTVFSGSVSDNQGPLMSKRGLITTLATLRKATQDETTLEGLRDSIGNAIGGLIEKFEQEIATMPAEDSE